jgi:hypothetical protein
VRPPGLGALLLARGRRTRLDAEAAAHEEARQELAWAKRALAAAFWRLAAAEARAGTLGSKVAQLHGVVEHVAAWRMPVVAEVVKQEP